MLLVRLVPTGMLRAPAAGLLVDLKGKPRGSGNLHCNDHVSGKCTAPR